MELLNLEVVHDYGYLCRTVIECADTSILRLA